MARVMGATLMWAPKFAWQKITFLFTVSWTSILRPAQPTAQLHQHSGLM